MSARTVTGIATQGRWKPVVDRAYDAEPHPDGIDFVLTPSERSEAAKYACAIEANRRRLNREDTAQAVADELTRGES